MQFTYSALAVLALSGFAAAQSIPACATQCLADASAKGAPSCNGNVACQCEPANKAAIQSLATPCVIGACPSSELQAVLAGAAALCSGAGSGSSSAAAPAGSSSSAAPAGPSSYSASTAPSSSAPAVSATYTTSAAPAASTTASSTTPSNGTTTAVPFTGSASQIAAGFGSVVAIGFAVLAAF